MIYFKPSSLMLSSQLMEKSSLVSFLVNFLWKEGFLSKRESWLAFFFMVARIDYVMLVFDILALIT